MLSFLQYFFTESPFIPHGHCYLWKPGLVWLHMSSDALIALAYYSIPLSLVYFVRKRRDLPFYWLFLLFSAFILSCGTTHVMEVWTLWHPTYWLTGFIKAVTALISLYTAIALVPIIPLALTFPSPKELEATNRKQEAEIVERSGIEDQLRSSQEMLQLVMDNIPQFIFWKDKNSVYLGCNRSFAQLTGFNSPQEVVGKTDHDLPWTAEQTAFIRERDVRVMETNVPETYLLETRQQADGKLVWMNTTKIPLHNSDGEVIGMLGSSEDITERKLAEDALRESEERWHLALEGNNDGIWDWDIKTDRTFRSPRFKEILGFADDEMASSNDEWITRIHPDDFDSVIGANRDYLSRKLPYYAVEYRLRCKDGDYKWVLSRGQAQWDEDGNPVRMVGSMSDISERKQVEIALYQLNVELEERVKERTAELEATNLLLQGQTQVLEMLARGASLSEMLNVLVRTVEEQSLETNCSIVVFPKPVKIDYQDVTLSGGLRTCFSEPIFSSKGEVLGTVTVSYRKPRRSRTKDAQLRQTAAYIAGITIERKRVEEDRSRLVAIFEASSDYVGTADPQGNSLWYNNQFKKAVGLDSDAEISQRALADNHPQWAFEVVENQGIPSAIRDGIWVGETALLCPDGVEIPVSQMIIAHKSPEGKVEYFSTIMRDISERKQAEVALQESYILLETVINSTPDCIFVKDRQGCYQLMNAPGASWFNFSAEEIVGVDDTALFPPELIPKIQADDRRIIISGQVETFEETVLIQGEWRTYLTTKNVYHDTQGNILGIVGFAKDISDRKEAEQKLKALNAELIRSNQELEQFAYIASHDLREPLRKIKSFADLLAKRYRGQLDDKADKYIGYITDGAVRMQALIGDLLTYSRVGRGELTKEPTNLNAVVEQTLDDLSKAIEESNATITAEPLPTLNANRVQMGQVFQNLITNAIKFRGEQPPRIEIKAALHQQTWTISVQDNGIGIDPQYADRIFIIFQRLHTKEEYEGTGIGLAVCKKIVERHGGKMWIESELEQGTTFFFTLPAF